MQSADAVNTTELCNFAIHRIKIFKFILLRYNVVLVSNVQQCDSSIYTHAHVYICYPAEPCCSSQVSLSLVQAGKEFPDEAE